MIAVAEKSQTSVLCISCAARGKQDDCLVCQKIQPKPLHQIVREGCENYARDYFRDRELAFIRQNPDTSDWRWGVNSSKGNDKRG